MSRTERDTLFVLLIFLAFVLGAYWKEKSWIKEVTERGYGEVVVTDKGRSLRWK